MKFEMIVQKFNYDLELSKFLEKVYLELINYFGNEEIVFKALFNTKIVSVNNVYTYLDNSNLLDEEETIVSNNDLKRCSGVQQSIPELAYNSEEKTYYIANVKSIVAVVKLDLNKTYSKATLIHELCHLIKAYYNEYTIKENILYSYCGLIERQFELSFDGNKVNKKLIKEVGVGLEEGLTSVDEEEITRNIIDSNYKSTGYGVVNAIARHLLQIPEIREVIINAELYHDKSELYNRLGIENYLELELIVDKIYALSLKMFMEMFEPLKMAKTSDEINAIIEKNYAPLMNKMKSTFKR